MAETLVQTRGIERRFGHRVALHGVDLTLAAGQITALAGPNGSGKTTLLKMLAGLLRPTSGSVQLFGLDPYTRRVEVMRQARFAFAPPPLYESLTGFEHMRFLSAAGLARQDRPDQRQIESALESVGLLDRAGDKVRAYSFGMRQRLVLAQCLVPLPKLLVLDEPTDGLDPLAILELRNVLGQLRSRHGIAIMLSSHLLVELEQLADELLVLHEGKPLYRGPPSRLMADHGKLVLEVDADNDDAAAALRRSGHETTIENGKLILVDNQGISLHQAAEILGREKITLRAFHEQRPTLETVLLARLRQAGSSAGATKT